MRVYNLAQAQGKTSLIGARIPRSLHREFKAECARLGLAMQDVVATMIRLFLEDTEFRKQVIAELRGGDRGAGCC